MKDFEKLGAFYLGRLFDPVKQKAADHPFLYDSKNLTTHAVCIGMTGSGKTGLGITLLEEAAIDKIPAIVVDPKGDLADLLLTFPKLSAEEFAPWVDPAEAERKGMTKEKYAEKVAQTWKEGLSQWGEDGQRIQNLRDAVEMAVYTPAATAGIPISILSSFAAPSKEEMADAEGMRSKVMSVTSSLLGLLGIKADPLKSQEHILLSSLIDNAWRTGKNLDINTLIQQVQKPPFEKLGALDIETVFPAKERKALAILLNNLLASPSFQAWMEGVPLEIDSLLYTKEGKPKLSILSIAHLSDPERMFFLTLLLNALLGWMRKQSGTSSLRALFYMDEIFGYFPPTAMPPSKMPLLILLKQARAFGLGLMLVTQNPADLDYKGLANCGTWFIGKLQTERDKARVLEGLNAASNGEMDTQRLDKMIASTGNRVFILRSIYEKEPLLFETRWTLSYLRGPLTLRQIQQLVGNVWKASAKTAVPAQEREAVAASAQKESAPGGIQEYFFNEGLSKEAHYSPWVMGRAKLHFVDAKAKVDTWQDVVMAAPADNKGKTVLWEQGKALSSQQLQKDPLAESHYTEMPAGLLQEKNYATFQKSFLAWLYQNQTFSLFRYPELSLFSNEGESEKDFRLRVSLAQRESRDAAVRKLQENYGEKIQALNEKIRRAESKMNLQHQQASVQKAETYISLGATILGAFFGRKLTKGTISQAGASMRQMGRVQKESEEAKSSEEDYQSLQQQLKDVQDQLQKEVQQLSTSEDPSHLKIEAVVVKPRKSDISVSEVALVWMNY